MAQVRDFLAAGPEHAVPPAVAAPTSARPTAAPEPEPTQHIQPTTPSARPAPRRSRGRPLAVALVLVVIITLAGIAWTLGRGEDPGQGAGTDPARSSDPASTAPAGPVSPDGMENFIESYLATVTTDPATAWQELTPAFQEHSGGFGKYRRFWSGFRSADVLSAQADPESMQISYRVEYVDTRGRKTRDEVTLTLEGTDGDFRIAAES